MKRFLKGLFFAAFAATVLIGCRPDNVRPTEDGSDAPGVSGLVGDPHPALDTVCSTSDTMFLVREDDGSPVINKCFGFGGVPVPCPPNQLPWGFLIMREGYYQNINYLDCDFTMAPGWYCNFNRWFFGPANSHNFDQNGLPIIDQDWGTSLINPAENQWHLRIEVQNLPTPCMDVALRVDAIKLNLFGFQIPGSSTHTWGRNRNWNVTGHPNQAPSQWLMRICPASCLAGPPLDTVEFCQTVHTAAGTTALTCNGNNLNCTTLHPTPSYAGNITYRWSNGETTQDLVACTNVNASYFVKISVDGVPTIIYQYNVMAVDESCTAEAPIVPLDFCTTNLNLRYGNTFNIRNYIRFYNGGVITGNQWNQVRFTYTEVGANSPTVPVDWNLAAFNAGNNVTVGAADYNLGTGNVGRGQYRIFAYRVGRTTYDDYITIRVNNAQVSTVTSAMCANIVGGPVCTTPAGENGGGPVPGIHLCNTPPGNPTAAVTECVPLTMVNNYVSLTCVANPGPGKPTYTIGACGSDGCLGLNRADSKKR